MVSCRCGCTRLQRSPVAAARERRNRRRIAGRGWRSTRGAETARCTRGGVADATGTCANNAGRAGEGAWQALLSSEGEAERRTPFEDLCPWIFTAKPLFALFFGPAHRRVISCGTEVFSYSADCFGVVQARQAEDMFQRLSLAIPKPPELTPEEAEAIGARTLASTTRAVSNHEVLQIKSGNNPSRPSQKLTFLLSATWESDALVVCLSSKRGNTCVLLNFIS